MNKTLFCKCGGMLGYRNENGQIIKICRKCGTSEFVKMEEIEEREEKDELGTEEYELPKKKIKTCIDCGEILSENRAKRCDSCRTKHLREYARNSFNKKKGRESIKSPQNPPQIQEKPQEKGDILELVEQLTAKFDVTISTGKFFIEVKRRKE